MKTVGPFVAARSLESVPRVGPPRPVEMLRALDRLTGLPVLVYLLPRAVALPELPDSPSLLPYSDMGVQRTQAYVACELPPHASLTADVLQAALGGLRALNALHEAGLIHGGVQPQQLWAWDNETRLAGATLPWGEAEGPYAAPEGGVSPAADLYALGASLLRLGPMPTGLSDLLSPYPAQRPSARDALALLNAGPPLPPEKMPLLIQAPLHPPAPPRAAVALPLIADPEERLAATREPEAPAPGLPEARLPSAAEPEQAAAGQETSAPRPAADRMDEAFDRGNVFPSQFSSTLEGLGQAEAVPADAEAMPDAGVTAEVTPVSAEPERAAVPDLPRLDAAQPVPGESTPIAAVPVEAMPTQPAPLEEARIIIAAPVPPVSLVKLRPPSEPVNSASGPQTTTATPPPIAPAAPQTSTSARQLRQVRIGWSQDGSWRVKKDEAAVPEGSERVGEPPPFVRSPAPRPASPALNYWWIGLVVLAMLLLILRLTFFTGAAPASSCCTLPASVLGSAGQKLSAPVRVSLVAVPAGSHLQPGTLIGQVPGPLRLDAPGKYALKVAGDGYAPQTVSVTVPSQQPLVITLK